MIQEEFNIVERKFLEMKEELYYFKEKIEEGRGEHSEQMAYQLADFRSEQSVSNKES